MDKPVRIYSGTTCEIYRELNPDSGKALIWKVPVGGIQSSVGLQNEYDVCEKFNFSGVRRPIEKSFFQNSDAYCYAHIFGLSLKDYVAKGGLPLERFFSLALKMVAVVEKIHDHIIGHFSINWKNVLVNPESHAPFFIDFTLANEPKFVIEVITSVNEDKLVFFAPECFRNKPEGIDRRSDLYSLGVAFYYMLTGELPYDATKPSDLLDHILSKGPDFDNAELPEILKDLVLRLMSTDKEMRYQNCFSLWHDLNELKKLAERDELSGSFDLGVLDKVGAMQISPRLYGRDDELQKMINAFDQHRNQGSHLIVVKGKSGVGKGKLVESFSEFLEDHDIYYLEARCESWSHQLQSAILLAIQELGVQILSRSAEELSMWQSLISDLHQEIGPLLFKIFPDLNIIDKLDSAETTGTEVGEIELNSVIHKLLSYISDASIPLVIGLRSIQNADHTTHDLISQINQHQPIKNLSFVLSLDDDEIVPSQNQSFVKDLVDPDAASTVIELDNWALSTVKEYIRDCLNTDEVEGLAQLIYDKTLGHPFFVYRMIDRIKRDHLANYNQRANEWTIDWDELNKIEVSEHVVDYQKDAIKGHSKEARDILAHAACIGLRFNRDILDFLLSKQTDVIDTHLKQFEEAYIIVEHSGLYTWNSEEIRLEAYDFFDHKQKSNVHFKVALYMEKVGHSPDGTNLFLARAYHYDRMDDSDRQRDQNQVAVVFFEAAQETARLGSFDLSLKYYRQLLELVNESHWKNDYEDTKAMYEKAIEVAMVCDDTDAVDSWMDKIFSQSRTKLDTVDTYELKLNYLTGKHDFVGAVALLLEVLDSLGFKIKRNPSQLKIMSELVAALWTLKNKKIKNLTELPLMEDPRIYAFMKLTVKGSTSIFGSAPDILPVIFFRQVRYSVKYGNCEYSPFAYISFGFAISVFMDQLKKGYEFGQMALELTDKLNAEEVRNRVLVTFYGFLSYWRDDLAVSLKPLRKAYHLGKQKGDYLYASFALAFESSIRFLCGQSLGFLLEEKNNAVKEVKSLNQDLLVVVMEIERQMVLNLTQPKEDVLVFDREGFNEDAIIRELEELEDVASKFDLYAWKLFLACIFGDFAHAYRYVAEAEAFSEETTSRQINYPTFLLVACLAGYEHLKMNGADRGVLKDLKSKEKTMALFAKNAPQNFECMLDFIQGCRLQYEKNVVQAEEKILKAIKTTSESRLTHLEALFRETLSRFYKDRGNEELEKWMRLRALECYRRWGAQAKVERMVSEQKETFRDREFGQSLFAPTFQDVHDFNTIISANKSLANATTVAELLDVMMDIILKSNTATSASISLRLPEYDHLRTLASFRDGKVDISDDEALQVDICQRVFRYVRRSKNMLELYDISNSKEFRSDPYVVEHAPKSVLSFPVVVKNQVEGVIYMENRNEAGVFDDRKIDFFSSIVSQFQVSLDNVTVHSRLEELVRERTQKLEVVNKEMQNAKEESERLLLNILPQETADELRRFGQTTAKRFNNVSVLFCDIVDFTKLSENLGPEDLVADLDLYFKSFDEICLKHGLEKIKTVGDAYLAAGGIPENNTASVSDVVRAAIEMHEFVNDLEIKRRADGRSFYQIRTGIHTGPVVAGVVGLSKFQYDIWGDTVNVAARLQQSSEPGRINVSHSTLELLNGQFESTHRGQLKAKNKGSMDMYFIQGVRHPSDS